MVYECSVTRLDLSANICLGNKMYIVNGHESSDAFAYLLWGHLTCIAIVGDKYSMLRSLLTF